MLEEAQDQLVQLGQSDPRTTAVALLMLLLGMSILWVAFRAVLRTIIYIHRIKRKSMVETLSYSWARWCKRNGVGKLSMFAKRKEIVAAITSDAYHRALDACVAEGLLTAKEARTERIKLGKALQKPDLFPGLKRKAYSHATKRRIQQRRASELNSGPVPIPEPTRVETPRKQTRLEQSLAAKTV